MPKCVAYCRVSTDKEDQLNSLENQIRHYTELFTKNGYEGADCGMYYSKDGKRVTSRLIPSIFADEGISGTKLKNREAFKYMLDCAYSREVDVIYVKNIARWARSVEDGSGILKKLKVAGVKVIFEDGNINNFDHEMSINILLSTAQEESRAKSTAVQFGIRKAQHQGKFTSSSPYGYISDNGYLKPVTEQLEVVKRIFHLYLNEGWGSTKISRQLNGEGIPTQKGKKWAQKQIYDILSNEIYIGKQVTHTVVNTDINVDEVKHHNKKNNKQYIYRSIKPVEMEEWITNRFEHLRIISDEDFNKVQDEYRKRKELHARGNRPSTKHLFSNLVFCGNCGKALRRKRLCTWKRKDGTSTVKFEWVCSNHDTYYNDICEYRNSWEENKLLERVKAEIENLKNNQDRLEEHFRGYLKAFLKEEEVANKVVEFKEKLAEIINSG